MDCGSNTQNTPLTEQTPLIASPRSRLFDVATTTPGASTIIGMAMPRVFPAPGPISMSRPSRHPAYRSCPVATARPYSRPGEPLAVIRPTLALALAEAWDSPRGSPIAAAFPSTCDARDLYRLTNSTEATTAAAATMTTMTAAAVSYPVQVNDPERSAACTSSHSPVPSRAPSCTVE